MILEKWETQSYLGLILVILAFVDIFWERPPLYDKKKKKPGYAGITLLAFGMFCLVMLLISDIDWEQKAIPLSVVGMIYLTYMLYLTNVVHGGADAKALMVLAMLFPLYPGVFSLPLLETPELMGIFFPFALLILFNAALATLVIPIALLFHNARKHDLELPKALLGYKKNIERDPEFCWPMEKAEGEKTSFSYFPKKGMDVEKEFEALRQLGRKEVWVTPKIPFLIPMLIGLLVSIVVGNILWLFF